MGVEHLEGGAEGPESRLWGLERQVFQLETLVETLGEVQAAEDLPGMIDAVLAVLMGRFGLRGAVGVEHEVGEDLDLWRTVASRGPEAKRAAHAIERRLGRHADWLQRHIEPVRLDPKDRGPFPKFGEVWVPIAEERLVLGGILLGPKMSGEAFTEENLAVLGAVARQTATSIQNSRLLELGRLKSDFISYVAHELNNPLTLIHGYTVTLLSDKGDQADEETRRRCLRVIERETDRIIRLTRDLLDLGRLEAGRPLEIHFIRLKLQPFLEKILQRFQLKQRPMHRLHLSVSDSRLTVDADPDKLDSAVSNLVQNAIKYCPLGGDITIGARGENAHVVISVADTGVGMTGDELERAFDKFERAARARNLARGAGVGLHLARRLAEAHGGRLWAESAPGKGSTFYIRLPRKHAGVMAEVPDEDGQ
jgi:signal transduction histidine kinase